MIIFSNISSVSQPPNFHVIDNNVSRSAQPSIENFKWLKQQGYTDVINFRTLKVRQDVPFDERQITTGLGLKYHPLPSVTRRPTVLNVEKFLNMTRRIKQRNGKVLIHCMAGADRTGMYSFIYKMLHNMGDLNSNIAEWKANGLNFGYYPHLISWARASLKRLEKCKY